MSDHREYETDLELSSDGEELLLVCEKLLALVKGNPHLLRITAREQGEFESFVLALRADFVAQKHSLPETVDEALDDAVAESPLRSVLSPVALRIGERILQGPSKRFPH